MENQLPQRIDSPLAKALALAQGKFKTPTLNRTAKIKNAQGQLLYETHYADIQECISCIKEPLSENGLSFIQTIDFIHTPKEMWVLRLTLRHSSGELVDSVLPLNVNQSPQQLGGSLTYFKRYQLSAFFGLAADFDDDGNAAEGKGNVVEGKPKEAKPTAEKNNAPMQKALAKAPPKNHAPGAKNPPEPKPDDLDAALGSTPMTKVEMLYALVDERGWTPEVVKEKMKLCLGYVKSSKDLNDDELDKILKFINLSSGRG